MIRERAEEALKRVKAPALPPGPWEIEREEVCVECSDDEQALAFPMTIGPIVEWTPASDDPAEVEAIASFVSHARADVPDFAAAVLRLTGPEMRAWLVEWTHSEQHADALMALLLAAAEGMP